MLLNLVGNQLITILWAIYCYVYHLVYDNMNTFVKDAADRPSALLMVCDWKTFLSGPLHFLFGLSQTLVNTALLSLFAIQGHLLFILINLWGVCFIIALILTNFSMKNKSDSWLTETDWTHTWHSNKELLEI